MNGSAARMSDNEDAHPSLRTACYPYQKFCFTSNGLQGTKIRCRRRKEAQGFRTRTQRHLPKGSTRDARAERGDASCTRHADALLHGPPSAPAPPLPLRAPGRVLRAPAGGREADPAEDDPGEGIDRQESVEKIHRGPVLLAPAPIPCRAVPFFASSRRRVTLTLSQPMVAGLPPMPFRACRRVSESRLTARERDADPFCARLRALHREQAREQPQTPALLLLCDRQRTALP